MHQEKSLALQTQLYVSCLKADGRKYAAQWLQKYSSELLFLKRLTIFGSFVRVKKRLTPLMFSLHLYFTGIRTEKTLNKLDTAGVENKTRQISFVWTKRRQLRPLPKYSEADFAVQVTVPGERTSNRQRLLCLFHGSNKEERIGPSRYVN